MREFKESIFSYVELEELWSPQIFIRQINADIGIRQKVRLINIHVCTCNSNVL